MNQATFSDIAAKTDAVTLASSIIDVIAPDDVVTVPKATFAEKLRTVLAKFSGDAVVYVDRARSKIIVTTASAVKSALATNEPTPAVQIETVPGEVSATRAKFRYVGSDPISPTTVQAAILEQINARRPSLSFDAIMGIADSAAPGSVLKFNQATGRLTIHAGSFNPVADVPDSPAAQTVTLDYSEILPVQSTTQKLGFFDRNAGDGGSGITLAKPSAPTLNASADQHDGTFNITLNLPSKGANVHHFSLLRDGEEIYHVLTGSTVTDMAVNEDNTYVYTLIARTAGDTVASEPSNGLSVVVPVSQPSDLPPGYPDKPEFTNASAGDGGIMFDIVWPSLPPRATSMKLMFRDSGSSSYSEYDASTGAEGTGHYGPDPEGRTFAFIAHGNGGDTQGPDSDGLSG